MREMKQSGIEYIEEIPKEWDIIRFTAVFSLGKGLNITKADLLDEGTPVVSYGEIHSKYGREVIPEIHALKYVNKSYLESDEKCLLFYGDFVFADTSEDIEGSGNFTFLNSQTPVFAGYHTIIARPKIKVNYLFLSFLCDCYKFRAQIQSQVVGIKVFSITKGILKTAHFWFPPLKEQETIANYLEDKCQKIDALIENQKNAIVELKEYKKSLVQKTVTKGISNVKRKNSGVEWLGEIPAHWEVVPTKQIMQKTKNICDKYNGEDILSLTMGGVIKRDLDNPKGKMPTTFDGYQKVYKNNLLLCLFDIDVTPRCVGLICDDGLTSPAYSQFVPSKRAYAPFYTYYLTAIDNDKTYLHLSKNLRSSLTEDDFGLIPIVLLPVDEQKAIAEYLDKKTGEVENLISIKQQKIAELKEYKKSLIYDYVTGKREV